MAYLKAFNNFMWTYPILFLLIGTHLIFTVRLRFPQRKVFYGIKLSIKNEDSDDNSLSGFAALATTLAATLGTGNIVGVVFRSFSCHCTWWTWRSLLVLDNWNIRYGNILCRMLPQFNLPDKK